MACNHRHVVVHRNDVTEHTIPEDGPETACNCGPAVLCPVCEWKPLYDDCFIVAPPELVDAHLAPPPKSALN